LQNTKTYNILNQYISFFAFIPSGTNKYQNILFNHLFHQRQCNCNGPNVQLSHHFLLLSMQV